MMSLLPVMWLGLAERGEAGLGQAQWEIRGSGDSGRFLVQRYSVVGLDLWELDGKPDRLVYVGYVSRNQATDLSGG